MSSNEIRLKFLEFFKKRGHSVIASSSLIPDDPSVLLTTAGMQQFKRYYTGELDAMKDFKSRRTVSVQKCFRTSDLEEVGDESHLTFFEMLGNFSFGPVASDDPIDFGSGGYFKKSAIYWAYEFITKEMGLEIDFVSVFEGDKEIPADLESEKIWNSIGSLEIKKFGRKDNFWGPTGKEGPCGPTTEIYVKGVEVWNIVFNEYYKHPDGHFEKLKNPGVDTGMGLERLAMVVQKKKNIFETDLFQPLFKFFSDDVSSGIKRVIIDHLRGATFLIADGVYPSNKEIGYVLRRILRRLFTYENIFKISVSVFPLIIQEIIHIYGEFYPKLLKENEIIKEQFQNERQRFGPLLEKGSKRVQQIIQEKESYPKTKFSDNLRPDFGSKSEDIINAISGEEAFNLYQSYGMPPEAIEALLADKGYTYHKSEFQLAFEESQKKHREISRAGMEKKFGGHGLIMDTGELKAANQEELGKATKLHTATHLLHQVLREVLGDKVKQMGSDITAERLRFDFSYLSKLRKEEIEKIEKIVNEKIEAALAVQFKEMNFEEAVSGGALAFFRQKYPEVVKVYSIGKFSKEVCGGPHVDNTKVLGKFKIIKEESSSAGVRRIRAILENTK